MGKKGCGKCGEMVDEAKAFCPECGHAFVDEKTRTSVSEFDQSNETVQLGNTMFNEMLSEMGLNISKQPDKDGPRVEAVAPAVQPAAAGSRRQDTAKESSTRSRKNAWLIAGVIAAVLLFVIAAIIVVIAFILYFRLGTA